MGLNAALKDRARVKRMVPRPAKVEGKTLHADTYGAWFNCRLELPSGSLLRDRATEQGGQRSRVVTAPTLLCGIRDLEGGTIEITARDQLEVDSDELGHAVWEITADPAPMRKKSRVIGWTVSLQRVEEHDFEPRLPYLPEQP